MNTETVIVCTQCKTVLYKGLARASTGGSNSMKWIPQKTGSYLPPMIPPKRCPRCEGSTIQDGADRHG